MYHKEDRFQRMARCYHAMAPIAVPQYHWLQDRGIDLIAELKPTQKHLVDLGGGSGRFVKKYLSRFHGTTASIVDASPAFLEIAEEYLASERHRVQLIQCPLEGPWHESIPGEITAITSMSCMHHFPSSEKLALYQRTYKALSEGGVFINIDEMRAPSDAEYKADMEYWWNHVNKQQAFIGPADESLFADFYIHFEQWKQRNLDRFGSPKNKGDDIHESPSSQLRMLEASGFSRVHNPFHFRLWTAIAGIKTESSIP